MTAPTPNGGGGADLLGDFARLPIGEQAIMILVVPIFAMIAVTRFVPRIPELLLTQHVLVKPPLVTIPGCDGAGLDAARLMVAVGLLIFTIATIATNRLTRPAPPGVRR